ncbi:MAG: luxQ [Segetibacter sp.]|nr:luxQ [Segetibacter sp.]
MSKTQDNFLENKQVLVAEDNAINQMVVKHTLLKLGALPDIAVDGVEAIEKIKTTKYDLVLMDIQMPRLDGYETARYIRNQLKNAVPIIAMTAFALTGEDEKCFESGMNGYISKPFTIESLHDSIKAVLETPSSLQDNPNILSNKEVAVDINMLYEIAGNDKAYIEMMIKTFLENIPGSLNKIEEAATNEDWENTYLAAHYTKSSLSVIKVDDMFDCVFKIEKNARNKVDLQSILPLVKKLKEKFAQAEQLLSSRFAATT